MLARLKEPSTWAAIGAALAALGVSAGTEEQWLAIGGGVGAAVAIVGAFLRERGA